MRPWDPLACAVVALLLLSGCTEAARPAAQGVAKEPLSAADLSLDGSIGAIQGHVVAEDLTPVEGAQVAVRGSALQDTTDASGLFQFRNVTPGKVTVDIVRIGFESQAKALEVVAGQVATLDVTLKVIAVAAEPYYEVLHQAGFLECAMGAVVFVAPCSYPYRAAYLTAHSNGVNLSQYGAPQDLQNNHFWLNFTVRPHAQRVVGEVQWSPSSAAATQMQLFLLCGDFDPVLNECTEQARYQVNTSTSPVRVDASGKNLTKSCPKSKFCAGGDHDAWFANDVAMPFNNPQFAFQQRFEVWDTEFFNGLGPVDFTVIRDG